MSKRKKPVAGNKVNNVGEILKTVLSDIRTQIDGSIKGLPTGFFELDRMLSGLNQGNLVVAAGHPGVGTTSFALRISEHISVDKDMPVLFFSLGVCKEKIVERMLLGRAHISLLEAREGKLEKKQWQILNKSSSQVSTKPIYIDDTSRLSPSELLYRAGKLKQLKGIKCIVVDFLQNMRLENKIDLHEKEIAEISKGLKLMALELNIPVLLLVQLSFDLIRAEEDRCEPRITDLGEAISVERYADVLMLIHREGYYGSCPPDSRYSQVIIVKNCNGSTGLIGLNFYQEFARFENITSQYAHKDIISISKTTKSFSGKYSKEEYAN